MSSRRVPEKRNAQRTLAREVTRLVHGEEAVARAERASGLLFGEGITELNVDEILAVFEDVPSIEIDTAECAGDGARAGRRAGQDRRGNVEGRSHAADSGGGVYVNNRRVDRRSVPGCAPTRRLRGRLFLVQERASGRPAW